MNNLTNDRPTQHLGFFLNSAQSTPATSPPIQGKPPKVEHSPFAFILSEIEINTPDSIQIAYDALTQRGLDCPALKNLLDAQMGNQTIFRDEEFANKVELLKQEVIAEIRRISDLA